MARYIFVTGGVMSGLGKGIATATIARLLKSMGHRVTAVKIDPYVNIDAGTMRPTEHGEVWVTDDGGEIDQDFGHYERFLCEPLFKNQNLTTGQIYQEVISCERRGDYLGVTVQVIPHITNEVKRRIEQAANQHEAEFCLVEIGGTVGDYENILFLEAARQMHRDSKRECDGKDGVCFVHVSYVPIPTKLGEPKTKLTQQSVRLLREIGIQPDIIICRSSEPLDTIRKKKISLFCDVCEKDIVVDPDLDTVYDLPRIFQEQNLAERILRVFGETPKNIDISEWNGRVQTLKSSSKKVRIGIVGKYIETGNFSLTDSYISVEEAIRHASASLGVRPDIIWINSKGGNSQILKSVSGIVVPGGFGASGIEGKIEAIRYARENKLPFLGLCLGLQMAVVEYARNVCGLDGANSTEICPKTNYPVVDILPEQSGVNEKGATMRLGSQPAVLSNGTKVFGLYSEAGLLEKGNIVHERHRHRYEVNPKFHEILKNKGVVFSGVSPNGRLVEFIELKDHPYFVATQAHPEFKSNIIKPAPLFYGFVKACLN